MPDTPSITIVKAFEYRNDPNEKWSNTYHFSGTTPTGVAGWKALADAIIAKERTFLMDNVRFVTALGYEAGNPNAVQIIDYTVAPNTVVTGAISGTEGDRAPGDAAQWVRWNTGTRNSRGKYVYLRKYFHGFPLTQSDADTASAASRAAMATYAAQMYDGTLPGGAKICGPQGDDVIAHLVGPFVTTRTLKRRGKRPSS